MSIDAHAARKRFAHSPIGSWESYLGGGNDMHTWIRLTFHSDGTGTIEKRGFDHHYLVPEHIPQPTFQWKAVADRSVEVKHENHTRVVTYDFRDTKNEYDIEELRIFELGRSPDQYGEIGFWISPCSLVYRGDCVKTEEVRGIVCRLWSSLRQKNRDNH